MSNNPCNRVALIFICDYLIMVLAPRTTKTMKGGTINERLAVKGKSQGLYIEDSRKAMQVVSLDLTLKKS
jgi:hypothetical protein